MGMQESEQKDRLKQKWNDYIREQEEVFKPSSSPDEEAKESPIRIVKKQKSLRRGQGEKWKSELVNPVLSAKLNRFDLFFLDCCHLCFRILVGRACMCISHTVQKPVEDHE
jgi:hypothetical protein